MNNVCRPSHPGRTADAGRTVALARTQRMFAQERETVLDGVAGDVIGAAPRRTHSEHARALRDVVTHVLRTVSEGTLTLLIC